MVQHVLLILVSAPLLALAAPVTLLLRVSSPQTRRRWLLPFLHSRVVRVLSNPVVAWLFMAHRHVGQPLHAARSTPPSRTRSSTTSSTCCS